MAASVATGTNRTTLAYTPEHARGSLTTASATLYYFSNPAAGVANELVAGATPAWRSYLSTEGRIVAEFFTSGGTTTPYYFVGDHLSSTTALTDQTGAGNEYDSGACTPAALCADRGDAWGKRRNQDGSDEPGCLSFHPQSLTLRGYTGQEDMDTYCLVNLNARLYDPTLGRLTSADPTVPDAMNGQAFNRYSYVTNNPLAYTDPSGYKTDPDSEPLILPVDGMPCWGCSGPGVWGVANDGTLIMAGSAQFAFSGGVTPDELESFGFANSVLNFGAYTFGVGGASKEFDAGEFAKGAEWAEAQAQGYWGDATFNFQFPQLGLQVTNWAAAYGAGQWSTSALGNAAYTQGGAYTLFLVAENSNGSSAIGGIGHAFVGGRDPNGNLQAWGFYPKNRGFPGDLFSPGQVQNDTPLLSQALYGNQNFAFESFSVDEAQFSTAMNFMQNYAASNSYDIFNNNCETAALNALNFAGVANTYFVPFTTPNEMYEALRGDF